MIQRLFIIAALVAGASPGNAAIYDLPPEGQDVIGAISTVVATYEDNLVDIARRHGLGYQDIVLANPPFGKKGAFTIVGEDGKVSKEKESYERDDFWATTSNKQLNFVQHVKSLLEIHGRAAVVVPDNVSLRGTPSSCTLTWEPVEPRIEISLRSPGPPKRRSPTPSPGSARRVAWGERLAWVSPGRRSTALDEDEMAGDGAEQRRGEPLLQPPDFRMGG